MLRINPSTPPAFSAPTCCATRRRSVKFTFRLESSANDVPNVMIPRPPSWMSSMITSCPARLKSRLGSMTFRPVTHSALVAVNSACRKFTLRRVPSSFTPCRPGRVRISPPSRIATANDSAISCGGFRRASRGLRRLARPGSGAWGGGEALIGAARILRPAAQPVY